MNRKTLRPAIAMIELIFALVVMGIVLMSAPQLVRTAAKSGYAAIAQEAINEAAAQANMIMGYHWDENDTDERFLDPILVTRGDTELNENNNTARRKGTPLESYRTFIRSDGQEQNASLTLGVDTGENSLQDDTFDDIDDFSGSIRHLKLIKFSTADNVERELDINISRTVTYTTDNADYNSSDITYIYSPSSTSPTTNIKSITVTLTGNVNHTELEKTIKLHAFSCNIGGYKLEEKDF